MDEGDSFTSCSLPRPRTSLQRIVFDKYALVQRRFRIESHGLTLTVERLSDSKEEGERIWRLEEAYIPAFTIHEGR